MISVPGAVWWTVVACHGYRFPSDSLLQPAHLQGDKFIYVLLIRCSIIYRYPFIPKSDQFHISPAASPEI